MTWSRDFTKWAKECLSKNNVNNVTPQLDKAKKIDKRGFQSWTK